MTPQSIAGSPRHQEIVKRMCEAQQKHGVYVSALALNAIDALGKKAAPLKKTITSMPKVDPKGPERMSALVPRLTENIAANL